ncbi:hypothetical protein [Halobaculum limi]|uniref:hypothetical protein n=1 Tax=Halobaculum limi TaxID=3031916 RepID=UPI002406344D|nr:hypothetical protein [Halobaculum sp. YSMS11]
MVADETTDGVRLAQLLASELTGDGDYLAHVSVTDADPDVEPTADGALAYRVRVDDSEDNENSGHSTLAEAFVHPDRVRVEFARAPSVAVDAAREAGLRVRPKAVTPPRTLVFVEDGAQVKRVLPVFRAVVDADSE